MAKLTEKKLQKIVESVVNEGVSYVEDTPYTSSKREIKSIGFNLPKIIWANDYHDFDWFIDSIKQLTGNKNITYTEVEAEDGPDHYAAFVHLKGQDISDDIGAFNFEQGYEEGE